jgi:hypothetical protein
MGKHLIGGIVMVMAATLLAPTARADQWDYVSQLDNHGVSYASILNVIETGKSACHHLRNGVGVDNVIGGVETLGYGGYEASVIVSAAVHEMCPDRLAAYDAWGETRPQG